MPKPQPVRPLHWLLAALDRMSTREASAFDVVGKRKSVLSGASLDLSWDVQEVRLKTAAAKLEEAEEAAEAAGVGDLFAAEEGAEEAQEDLEDAEEENEAAQEEVSARIPSVPVGSVGTSFGAPVPMTVWTVHCKHTNNS